ncbi:hypothetical protein WEH80_26615 [Actinomycetes bacterium KLBMP 9759]
MSVTANPTHREIRAAALTGIVGAFGYIGTAVVQAVHPAEAGDPGFLPRSIVSIIAAALLVGTVVGLARAGASGARWLARIGLVALGLGWLAVAAAHVTTQLRGAEFTLIFVIATALHLVGAIPVAWAVLRTGVWTGARRWIPTLCFVYLLVATPLFGLPGAPGQLVIAGWGTTWLLLGLAVYTGDSSTRSSGTG